MRSVFCIIKFNEVEKEEIDLVGNFLWNKFSEVFLLLIIIAMLFPQGRMFIGGFVNGIKVNLYNPSIIPKQNQIKIGEFDWPLTLEDGSIINPKYQDKVLFVNLWATWCPPCVREMPEIQSLYDKYAKKEVIEFLMISNESFDLLSPFMKRKKYDFPIYSNSAKVPDKFYSKSIPSTFIVSKSGHVVVSESGAVNWNSEKINELIERLIAE